MNAAAPDRDDELVAALRELWQTADPPPDDLADRIIAAVASDDIGREYALLTLVEDATAAVRGEAEALTLQFSDGRTTILLHVTDAGRGRRRIDGWADTPSREVSLVRAGLTRSTMADENGRFAFDDVEHGLVEVRLTVADDDDDAGRSLSTPPFAV